MRKLIILKGLPGSGKTTYAKEQVDKSDGRLKRVSKDDLRAMLDNGKWTRENEKHVLESRDVLILTHLKHGHDVIVDDTNFAPHHEARMKELANEAGIRTPITIEVKLFDVPLDECILRDSKREKPVGERVIREMHEKYFQKPARKVRVRDESLPSAIICDIDGTLAHMTNRGPFEWDKVGDDECDDVIRDMLALHADRVREIIMLSGREDVCREATAAWLRKHDVAFDQLLMRQAGDHRKDSIIKKEIFDTMIDGKFDVRFVLDDRNQVVEMWRAEGLKCLQVEEGNF